MKPPADLSHREWWFLLKLRRQQLYRELPLSDPKGKAFVYGIPDLVFQSLHYVDQRCSGELAMADVLTADDQARQHYLVNSLMEEAIRSSQLEGATTSRRAAKALLRSGREPRDRSERMILSNYRALQFMREGIGDSLTPEAVLELQRILTEGTLDNPDAAGRLQHSDEDRVAVFDRNDGSLLYAPPPADQLKERLKALCEFANDGGSQRFIHPVIRAILLHFWLAYDHPFEDGNGRTARALFYWYMGTNGYWLVEYLSISSILRKAPSKYTKAFLYTETDERDTTYFIVYQLEVIQRAVEELDAYLRKKVKEIRDVEKLIKGSPEFNHRQLALLGNAVRESDTAYSFNSHASSHNVTHETARNDLRPLVEKGLLKQHRVGRKYLFTPSPQLPELLKRAAE
ncbi:MAG TPA: Fic family protein [Solirubrobacterales bacterium]|nr:Fic family protein [Solirubrobacterales bacterium]